MLNDCPVRRGMRCRINRHQSRILVESLCIVVAFDAVPSSMRIAVNMMRCEYDVIDQPICGGDLELLFDKIGFEVATEPCRVARTFVVRCSPSQDFEHRPSSRAPLLAARFRYTPTSSCCEGLI